MTKQQRANETLKRLNKKYSSYPPTGLKHWETDWQFLFAVIMSARSNDDQINKITPNLFKKYKELKDFVEVDQEELAKDIKSSGFYNSKAKHLRESARKIIEDYGSKVPHKMKELMELPGVGRKTANVFQGVVLGRSEGIAVDTHVSRMSRRLKLTNEKAADKIEEDLMKLYSKRDYHKINPILFWHGRTICLARKPKCDECRLNDFCPSSRV